MASPEFKEGQKSLVERKTEFADVPESLRGTVTSVDAQRTPISGVAHGGEHLIKPTHSKDEIPYSEQEIQQMMGGSIGESSTWLGTFFDRARKIIESIGKRVGFSKGTA
jgi:hypothetical protein